MTGYRAARIEWIALVAFRRTAGAPRVRARQIRTARIGAAPFRRPPAARITAAADCCRGPAPTVPPSGSAGPGFRFGVRRLPIVAYSSSATASSGTAHLLCFM